MIYDHASSVDKSHKRGLTTKLSIIKKKKSQMLIGKTQNRIIPQV